jgi:hypothetical protein
VLFELASRDIGFDYDEDPEHLGEALRLPPQHEHLRAILEERLTPLRNPRAGAPGTAHPAGGAQQGATQGGR